MSYKKREYKLHNSFDIEIYVVCSGGVPITVTGENMDSVAEPIMVFTVITNNKQFVYYQV